MFKLADGVVGIGLGLRPALTGVGMGRAFLEAGLRYAARTLGASSFALIGSARRTGLAAFDAATGALTAWNPAVSGRVYAGYEEDVFALLVAGGRLYVAGGFTGVAGYGRHSTAAFDAATGALTTWKPDGPSPRSRWPPPATPCTSVAPTASSPSMPAPAACCVGRPTRTTRTTATHWRWP